MGNNPATISNTWAILLATGWGLLAVVGIAAACFIAYLWGRRRTKASRQQPYLMATRPVTAKYEPTSAMVQQPMQGTPVVAQGQASALFSNPQMVRSPPTGPATYAYPFSPTR